MNWTIMDTLVGTWRCHGEPVFGQAPLTRQSVYFPLFVIAFNVAGTSIHHRIRIQVHQLYAILVSSIRYYHSPVFKLQCRCMRLANGCHRKFVPILSNMRARGWHNSFPRMLFRYGLAMSLSYWTCQNCSVSNYIIYDGPSQFGDSDYVMNFLYLFLSFECSSSNSCTFHVLAIYFACSFRSRESKMTLTNTTDQRQCIH